MTTFDDVKRFEGMDITIFGTNGNVYEGTIEDIRIPEGKDIGLTRVAMASFKYVRSRKGEKTVIAHDCKNFPVRNIDLVVDYLGLCLFQI